MSIAILLFIHACSNNLFYLVPFYQVTNVFYVKDVGNFLIMVSLFFCLIKRGELRKFKGIFTWLIFYYVLFVLIQAAMASIKYEQSMIVGLIKTRDQLYYLSFFLYVYIFTEETRIHRFMDMLTVISFVLIALSVVNYFGPTIFYHRWAEYESMRSGIQRAFIPGMSIITTSFVWQFNNFLNQTKAFSRPSYYSMVLFAGIIFRQTRMLIFSAVITAIIMLLVKKKYKLVAVSMAVYLLAALVYSFVMEQNILFTPYSSAYENVTERTGTWRGRLVQLKVDWEVFKENMWFGSGLSAIRGLVLKQSGTKSSRELAVMAYMADLGYTHWAKFYGIFGLSWLMAFIISFYHKYFRLKGYYSESEMRVVEFANYSFAFFLVANITHGCFFYNHDILLVCLSVSILTVFHNKAKRIITTRADGNKGIHLM